MSYNPGNSIRNILNGGKRKVSTPKQQQQQQNKKIKQAKRIDLSVTFFDNPGEKVLQMEKIPHTFLSILGSGTLQLNDDLNPEQIHSKLISMLRKILKVEIKDEENLNFSYLKKEGKKLLYERINFMDDFQFDMASLKQIGGRDAKHLYIVPSVKLIQKGNSSLLSQIQVNDELDDSFGSFGYIDDTFPASPVPPPSAKPTPSTYKISSKHEQRRTKTGEKNNRRGKQKTPADVDSLNDLSSILAEIATEESKVTFDEKYNSLWMAFVFFSKFKDFVSTVAKVLETKSESAVYVEGSICQIVLALHLPEYHPLCSLALEDLYHDLELGPVPASEVIKIVLQYLRSLNCNIWSDLFLNQLFTSILTEEYSSGDFEKKETNADVSVLPIAPPKRSQTLLDIFQKFTNEEIETTPERFKDELDEDEVWKKRYFEACPAVLILTMSWKFGKNEFLDSSEVIPAWKIQHGKTKTKENYYAHTLILSKGADQLLVFEEKMQWKIYWMGRCYNINSIKKLYNLADYLIDMVVYTKNEVEFCVDNDDKVCFPKSDSLLKRMEERKKLTNAQSQDVVEIESENEEEFIEKCLSKLYGQDTLKQRLKRLARRVVFNKTLGDTVKNEELHMVFYGNPGTGKTSAARLMGEIFNGLGVIQRNHVVEVQRSNLVAEHIGGTAPKTLAAIEKAKGGILFVDEAYRLIPNGPKDYDQEVVDTIMRALTDDSPEAQQ